ncbi:U3 snoRNP protein [Vanrija albida]|uniref:U3 snoRNP protein n=1 Tax=Vanrija albida TaxID=181172 RepID=A0ABR3Q689_9TREE
MAEPPQKRFRYATYTEKLNNISVDVGKRKGLSWEKEEFGEDEQTKTPFTVELARLELHDLTLPYQELSRALSPLTATLPMTLHNLSAIFDIFFAFFAKLKDGEDHINSGLDSALSLLQALYETVLGEAVAFAPETAKHITRIGALRALEPKLVERAYSTLSLVLRVLAPNLLKLGGEATLRATWEVVTPYLRPQENKAYVRKCIADAWAGVLRKARGEALQRLMRVLLEEDTEGMEAVWTNSMKGTSQHLHSRAIPIFTTLLDELVLSPTEEHTATLRHVSTALVHHCSSSATAPLVEAVLSRVAGGAAASSSKSTIDYATSTAMLEVLCAFLMTRKGKRFPAAQLKPTMVKLQGLIPQVKASVDKPSAEELASKWRRAVVSAIVGSLNAGHLAEWLSPGVALIEALWAALPTPEAFAFVNMCIAFKWAGIEQFLLAHVARTALTGLSSDPLPTLVLLNNLASAGFLSGGLSNVQGGRWRQALVTNLAKLLKDIRDSDLELADRRILGQILRLIPSLAGESQHFIDHLMAILDRLNVAASDEDAEGNWEETGVWNDAHAVGRILSSVYDLVLRGPTTVKDKFKTYWTTNHLPNVLVGRYHWNREILEQTAAFVEHWPEVEALDDANVDRLRLNVLSADSSLRLSSLKILVTDAHDKSKDVAAIWQACLAVESAQMSLKNVRDRTTQIARLTRHLSSLSTDVDDAVATTVNSALSYLVSQLKVNFRPLWSETVTALTAQVPAHGNTIWTILWEELQKTITATKAVLPDLGVEYPEWTTQRAEIDDEEEDGDEDHEFRCGALAKNRANISKAWQQNDDVAPLDVAEISIQISRDRLDVLSYETQLLATLTANPSLAEKHTRSIVPVVLAIAGASADEATVELAHLTTRQLQARTTSFLELLVKFVNPKAAYRSAELHALYLNLLSKGEPKVQGVALRCLLTYKSPNLVPYKDRLSKLLDETQFRDELTHFDLATDSEVVEPKHRPELLSVVIRLLYGIMMSRRARSATAQGQGARKQAVLTALSGVSSDELKTLIDLMLEPFGGFENVSAADLESASISAPGRQQLGFLAFQQEVLRYLAPQTVAHWPRLIGATVVLVHQAQREIEQEQETVEEEAEADEEEVEAEDKGAAPLRTIRSTGLKRLVQFLRSRAVEFDFKAFLPVFFKTAISPRLAKLEVENTQAPSGTLDLIAGLAASPETSFSLVKYDDRTLPKTFACMTAVKVKPAVIGRVFDVVESLLADDEDEDKVIQNVLIPNIRPLIDNIIGLVQSLKASANEEIMRRLLGILSRLSAVVSDGQQAQQLAALLGPMLRQPGKQVNEKAKVNILVTLQRLYAISPDFKEPSSAFFSQSYELISNLLQTLNLPTSRRALIAALETFGEADSSLAPAIEIVANLNAYRVKRMDEPDFDRRFEAFGKLNDLAEDELPQTSREWLPILRSALHFVQDAEELSIRTNASSVLQRFVTLVGDAESGPLVEQLQFVVLPALRRCLLSKQELVRNEVLLVFSKAIKECSGVPALAELQPLLGDEDETNIFVNLGHIQVHRRARAIRRLRDVVVEGGIREATIANVFLPILEHIIAGSTEVTDHHLVNESIIAIGVLAGRLSWSKYNALVMRYLRLGTPKSAQQKFYIRCVSSLIDNFAFDLRSDVKVGSDESSETLDDAAPEDEAAPAADEAPVAASARITEVVLARLLPALSHFIARKHDETADEAVRIPVALGIVKLASALPEEASANEILRVVTTVSQILRSKDQDTRDIARDTIGKIAVFLGPEWLGKVLAELRTALQRGPQKHVLAVTTHSILVLATTEAADRFSNLDQAVGDAVSVSAEVIWGESGQDVATEGFKTKMREVRGALSRGNDTFQLVSRLVSPSKIGAVLAPVREIMHVSQAVKTMLQVDEVLRRIALGLNANALINPTDILSLSFSLINGNSQYLRAKKKEAKSAKPADRFQVQMKRKEKEDEDMYPQNAHKFVSFGLELFITAFRRGKFDFEDVDILARLGPLVNAIGNTLYSPNSSILVLGLKATAAIAKCPIPQVDEALPAFVTNIFKVIKNAGGTAESEVAQTALKTLAVLIRDCKASQVSDSQLRYLIEVVNPDLEDHDRQSCIFTVLRAVVSRRFVVPEIYDVMDRVSSIMVTSQSTHVQELCRGLLMQFLLDYPQGQGRLKSQMTFLARNLDYVFESGRVSVMEVLSAVFGKFSGELVAEYADMFFVALVAVLANDDSEKCRNMAGVLLQQLFGSLEEEHQKRLLQVLKAWVDARNDNAALAAASLAVYGLLCESDEVEASVIAELPAVVLPVIRSSARALARAEASDDEITLEHALPQQALSVIAKALKANGELAKSIPWADIVAHLLFPHEWVRFGAARALAVLFAGEEAFTVLDADLLLDIARKSCILFGGSKSADGEDVVIDAKLADQLVKLLWNIAKHWATSEENGWTVAGEEVEGQQEEDEDEETEEQSASRPLAWLMSRLSFLARRLIISRPAANDTLPGQPLAWTGPVMSILRCYAGIYEALNKRQARGFLIHILSPIYRILDDEGDLAGLDGAGGIDDLRTLATEVRDFVQAKVGATNFSKTWEKIRRHVGDKRQVRREARSRMAVADPKAWAARQERRGEKKKESKKRKVHAHMDHKNARQRRG